MTARTLRRASALALVLKALAPGAIAFGSAAPVPQGAGATTEPPLGRAVVPPVPLPGQSPDPARLALARALFEAPERFVEVGGYALYSDVEAPELLARIAAVVGGLEAIYEQRYGRRPIDRAREAIVLFESESAYRRLQATDPRLAALGESTGLAGKGVVSTYRGARTGEEVIGTLVHELTHLLNRRALGPSLPSWLDEGMADDLGASRLDRDGRLLPGSWSRTLTDLGAEIRISGGEAALRNLAAAFGGDGSAPIPIDLGAVLGLDWEAFVAPESAELHYAIAASFLRMLLASPARSELFRAWLDGVAQGEDARAEALRRALGAEWGELARDLALWTRSELVRLPSLPTKRGPSEPSHGK